jgi:hypothetical protein
MEGTIPGEVAEFTDSKVMCSTPALKASLSLLPHAAVDALAEQVSVAVMAGVLLDHVN